MATQFELLMQKLKKEGHVEIAKALRRNQADKLSDQQRMILADASICIRMAHRLPDAHRLRNSLVGVTSSGWGREPEITEPGLIQPLMNL